MMMMMMTLTNVISSISIIFIITTRSDYGCSASTTTTFHQPSIVTTPPSQHSSLSSSTSSSSSSFLLSSHALRRKYRSSRFERSSLPPLHLTIRGGSSGRSITTSTNTLPSSSSLTTTLTLSSSATSTPSPRGGATATKPPPPQIISRLFPIYPSELPTFTLMSLMMFFFIYVFTTTRDTKDTLVITHCGAESIPFLKIYGVMPCAAAFIMIYSRLSGVLGREALFYVTLVPFFLFYAGFAFFLFPMRGVIHFPVESGGGGGGGGEVKELGLSLLRYWSFSLYYIVSELFANASIPILFWQCANHITKLDQAKRFYPIFAVFGNLAPILSGRVMSEVVARQKTSDDVGFGQTLQILATIKLFAGAAICLCYYLVNKTVIDSSPQQKPTISKKDQPKMSLKELFRNAELSAIAAIVFGYYFCLNLTEVLWKSILRQQYPGKSEYMSFMGRFSQLVGGFTLALQLSAPEIIRALGWKRSSLLVPSAMSLLALPFFAAATARNNEWGGGVVVSVKFLFLISTAQSIVNKVAKYTLYDPLKEMAYIPLDPEIKVKGKAVVEMMGSKVGKGVASAIQQFLVVAVGGGTILGCAPILGVLYLGGIVSWGRAVVSLGGLFDGAGEDDDGGGGKKEKGGRTKRS